MSVLAAVSAAVPVASAHAPLASCITFFQENAINAKAAYSNDKNPVYRDTKLISYNMPKIDDFVRMIMKDGREIAEMFEDYEPTLYYELYMQHFVWPLHRHFTNNSMCFMRNCGNVHLAAKYVDHINAGGDARRIVNFVTTHCPDQLHVVYEVGRALCEKPNTPGNMTQVLRLITAMSAYVDPKMHTSMAYLMAILVQGVTNGGIELAAEDTPVFTAMRRHYLTPVPVDPMAEIKSKINVYIDGVKVNLCRLATGKSVMPMQNCVEDNSLCISYRQALYEVMVGLCPGVYHAVPLTTLKASNVLQLKWDTVSKCGPNDEYITHMLRSACRVEQSQELNLQAIDVLSDMFMELGRARIMGLNKDVVTNMKVWLSKMDMPEAARLKRMVGK